MTRISGTTPLSARRSARTVARPRRDFRMELRLELRDEPAPVRIDATLCADPFLPGTDRWLGEHAQVITLRRDGREAMARASVSVDEIRADGTLVGRLEVEDGWDLRTSFEARHPVAPAM